VLPYAPITPPRQGQAGGGRGTKTRRPGSLGVHTVHGESHHPLPTSVDRRPDQKPLANAPAVPAAAKAELVQLIDGQIATRRAEIDELTRLRRILVGNRQPSGG
jgi:hypothetical protein